MANAMPAAPAGTLRHYNFPATTSSFRDDVLRGFAAAGTQYLIFRMADWNEIDSVKLFADKVIPAMSSV